MTKAKTMRPVLAACAASAICVAGLLASPVQPAQANTYSNLVNAQSQHAASVQREAQLKQQLAGASTELADKIMELDDLTNNKIVAAQDKVTQANADAATAQEEADAAASRLEAAQKDKEDLEAQIEKTGKDYDDAHAAVAQLAREEQHGSDASEIMSVVTGASSTKDFVNSMQSRDALSRNEANAASSAATELNTSMNRSERLDAIEKQIATLKTQADNKAAAAQSAAETAQNERDALEQLRQEGEARRNELTGMVSSLKSQSAKQAAQTVLIASQVDSYNQQYIKEQATRALVVRPHLLLPHLLRPLPPVAARLPAEARGRAPRMVMSATGMWPANARGMRTTGVRQWASARHRSCTMAASGTFTLPNTVCGWITARRLARLSPSRRVWLALMATTVTWPWWKPCTATRF